MAVFSYRSRMYLGQEYGADYFVMKKCLSKFDAPFSMTL